MAAPNARSFMMAAEAATVIVSQKLEILLSHPVFLGCLSMETQAKAAKKNLAMIQESFSTQDKPPKSTEWLGRFLRAMYDAEEFIDKFHVKETCRRHKALNIATRPLATLVSKSMLCRDLSNLVKATEKLWQEQYLMSKMKTEGVWQSEPGDGSSCSHAGNLWHGEKLRRLTAFWQRQVSTSFICHPTMKKDIMRRIEKDAASSYVRIISILGKQNTGKTFLARWAYKEAMYLGFDPRAWVHVSAIMDKRQLLFEILKQVDERVGDMRSMNEDQLTDKLYKQLAKTKFLIVLDDVQPSNGQLLDSIPSIIHDHADGCIIITTQDEGIAKMMSPFEDRICLHDLARKEEMFAKKLHGVPDSSSLTDDEKKIIERCPKMPLCVSLLGGLLSNARENERPVLPKDISMTSSKILKLCYHRLPDHLKPCFIYMALFPAATPIPTGRLVRLWLAEGLLNLRCYDREGKTTPEGVGEVFILELVERNLIDVVSWRADGSPKACQMPTSLCDMIRLRVMGTGLLHIHGRTDQQQQLPAQARVRWLAEHMSIVTDGSGASYPYLSPDHVRSFLSFYPRRGILTKDISKFLAKLTSKTDYSLLRVLDLEGVYKPSLQGVLPKLVLLRYLGLRSTVLDSIPREVGDLHYLETLDIKHSNITSLPSSLWKARNLRHLHLSWFYIDFNKILKACSNNFMALTQLQTLSGLVIGDVNENLMRDHVNSLTTLTTLKLILQQSGKHTPGAAGETIANWISLRLTNLQSLTVAVIQQARSGEEAKPNLSKKAKLAISHIGRLPKLSLAERHRHLLELSLIGRLEKPIWTNLLPGSLMALTLSGSMVKDDIMPKLGSFLIYLRTLRLLANSFQGTSLKFIEDGFPRLVMLKIWKLPKLEKVIIQPGAMKHLKELECRFLNNLKDVEGIDYCTDLETICVVFGIGKGTPTFVDNLQAHKSGTTNLYKIEVPYEPDQKWGDDEDPSP